MELYKSSLSKDQVSVFLVDKVNIYPTLKNEIISSANKYGFRLLDISELDGCGSIIKHVIIFDGENNPDETTKKYLEIIEKSTSVTLSISYTSDENFFKASESIERLKVLYKGKVNYLRPNRDDRGFYTPSLDKLVDNSICDSVRVKYKPRCASDSLNIDLCTKEDFLALSNLFKKFRLYHRSPTDGFISIRKSSNEFYITSTKTDKIDLDLSRVCLVHRYESESNILTYSGSYLPSSDSVEAAIVYMNNKDITALVHTHASDHFTRNPFFKEKVLVPQCRYGEIDLGNRICNSIKKNNISDFIIMDDHGEVFISRKSDEIPLDIEEKITSNIELYLGAEI